MGRRFEIRVLQGNVTGDESESHFLSQFLPDPLRGPSPERGVWYDVKTGRGTKELVGLCQDGVLETYLTRGPGLVRKGSARYRVMEVRQKINY